MSPTARPAPRSLGELFWAFSWLSLQGFGGVLAVVHRELVDKRRWLTEADRADAEAEYAEWFDEDRRAKVWQMVDVVFGD